MFYKRERKQEASSEIKGALKDVRLSNLQVSELA